MSGTGTRRPVGERPADDRRYPLRLPGEHCPGEVDDDPSGSGEFVATSTVALEAMALLVVELPTVALEQDRRPDDAEVDLVAADDGMELDRRKLVVLHEALHPPLQFAVEELAVDHPVFESVTQRRHPRAATAPVHADRRVDRVGRCQSVGDDVARRPGGRRRGPRHRDRRAHEAASSVGMPRLITAPRSRRSRGRWTTTPSSVACRERRGRISSGGSSIGRGMSHR